MRILIFSAFEPIPPDEFPPLRYAHLAEEFTKRGHTVDFVTSSFFHMHKVQRKHKTWYPDGNPENLNLHLIPTTAYRSHTGLRRLFSYFILSRNLKKYLHSIPAGQRPDLIVAAYPPISANYVLAKWAKRKRIPFVMDIQDVWPYNFSQLLPLKAITGLLLNPLKKRFRYIAKHASAIVPVSSDYFQFTDDFIAGKVVKSFPLGADAAFFPDIKKSTAGAGAYRFLYVGNASTNTMLTPIIDAVGTHPDSFFHIIGLAGASPRAEKYIEDKGYENIRITPWLPPIELTAEVLNYDTAFLIVNPHSHIAFPYKTFTYWMAGLPVISNIRGGEVEKLIREHNLGITLTDDTAEAIEQGIAFCRKNFSFADRERIQRFARETFDTGRIYADYCDWIEQHFGAIQ